MSTRGGRFLGTDRQGRKPPHPDRERWFAVFFGVCVVAIGLWGAPIVWWVVRHNTRLGQAVQPHLHLLSMVRSGFQDGAWFFLGLTVLGPVWTVFVWVRWGRRIRQIRGQYLALVIPRPQQTREAATNTNPEAPYVVW